LLHSSVRSKNYPPDREQRCRTANVRISLLHATYHREGGPLALRDTWLRQAEQTESIDYVVAMDSDDTRAIAETEGLVRAVSPATPVSVTSVRNWNVAASLATGDLLFVIADDLYPPAGWDTTLAQIIRGLDPTTTHFAVKATDDPDDQRLLLRHPVVSRTFYAKFGLFNPEFRGVYCDDDITQRALWRSRIIDGRNLVLEHRHPELDASVPRSMSHNRVNTRDEYTHGREVFESLWDTAHRSAAVWFVRSGESEPLSAAEIEHSASTQRALAMERWMA
jgi:hypothetical protein